jgi:hypothetical protein
MDEMELLNNALGLVAKAGTGMDTLNMGVMSREDLSDVVVKLFPKDTPVRNRLKRIKGTGLAHSWNQLADLGTGGGNFSEGGLPTVADSVYVRKSEPYKLIGNVVRISDLMIAAGANFADALAFERENKILKTMLDEEYQLINGDPVAGGFKGLTKQITTNTKDMATNTVGLPELNEMFEAIYLKGGTPRCVVLGPREKRALNNQLLSLIRYQAPGATGEAKAGMSVQILESDFGEVELVVSRNLVPTMDLVSGLLLSQMLILDDQASVDNGNAIEVVELVPMSRKPLGPTTSAVEELIWEAITLVVRAEIFQARIYNIGA